jgi:histidine triad (HIT) family protein
MTDPYAYVPIDLDAYAARSRTGPCFICEIVDGTTQGEHLVYRDDTTIAFLNRYPTLVG